MAKKRKGKAAVARRDDRIGMRISAADRAAFEAAARRANRTLSDWVVQTCRVEAAKKGR